MKYNRKLLKDLFDYYEKTQRCLWGQINIPENEHVYDDMNVLWENDFIRFEDTHSSSSSGQAWLINNFRITDKGKKELTYSSTYRLFRWVYNISNM